MEKFQITENIKKANTKFNVKMILSYSFKYAGCCAVVLMALVGFIAVICALSGVNAIVSPALLVSQVKSVLLLSAGGSFVGIPIVGGIATIYDRIKGKRNLKTLASQLNTQKADINVNSLKSAEIVETIENKTVTTTENKQQTETVRNDIIMQSNNGRIVIARECIKKIQSGKKLKLANEESKYSLLTGSEKQQVIDENVELVQKVLVKKI